MPTRTQKFIQDILLERGWTVTQFARELNENLEIKVQRSTIHYWSKGQHEPFPQTLFHIRSTYPAGDWRHEFANTLPKKEVEPAKVE